MRKRHSPAACTTGGKCVYSFVRQKKEALAGHGGQSGESPERLLQRFKRICSKEGILREIKKRSFYEKPSERRRRRQKESRKALRKKMVRAAARRR